MGGGNKSESASEGDNATEEVICQMCEHEGHIATECKWVYSNCEVPTCNGLRKLLISKDKKSYGKKYLKCQHDNCVGFKWLEEEIEQSSSSSSQSSNNGCFICGLHGHWMSSCPWKETACPNGCSGARKLWTSHKPHSYGKKFLKCIQCGNFQWLVDVVPNYRRGNVKVKIEMSLDDLCQEFDSKINYGKSM